MESCASAIKDCYDNTCYTNEDCTTNGGQCWDFPKHHIASCQAKHYR